MEQAPIHAVRAFLRRRRGQNSVEQAFGIAAAILGGLALLALGNVVAGWINNSSTTIRSQY